MEAGTQSYHPLSDAVKSPPPKTCFPNTPATSVRNQTRGLDMIVDYHKIPLIPHNRCVFLVLLMTHVETISLSLPLSPNALNVSSSLYLYIFTFNSLKFYLFLSYIMTPLIFLSLQLIYLNLY